MVEFDWRCAFSLSIPWKIFRSKCVSAIVDLQNLAIRVELVFNGYYWQDLAGERWTEPHIDEQSDLKRLKESSRLKIILDG